MDRSRCGEQAALDLLEPRVLFLLGDLADDRSVQSRVRRFAFATRPQAFGRHLLNDRLAVIGAFVLLSTVAALRNLAALEPSGDLLQRCGASLMDESICSGHPWSSDDS